MEIQTKTLTLRNQIAEQKAELKRLEKIQKDAQKKRTNTSKTIAKMNLMCESVDGLIWLWSKTKMCSVLLECNNDLTQIINTVCGRGKKSQKIKTVFEIDVFVNGCYAKNKLSLEDFVYFINFFTEANFSLEEVDTEICKMFPSMENVACNVCANDTRKCDMSLFVDNNRTPVCECKYDVCFDCGWNINPQKCVLCRVPFSKVIYKL